MPKGVANSGIRYTRYLRALGFHPGNPPTEEQWKEYMGVNRKNHEAALKAAGLLPTNFTDLNVVQNSVGFGQRRPFAASNSPSPTFVTPNFHSHNSSNLNVEDNNETDEERLERISARFKVLNEMAEAISNPNSESRSLVVSGSAGCGKTYGIEQVLRQAETKYGIAYTVIRGYALATGVYKTLYEFRHPNSVVVFDDCDKIFMDETSLNLCKVACDTTETRVLSWKTETKMEDENGDKMVTEFEFEGNVIFVTNLDLDRMIQSGNRLSPHYEALISRSYYLDLMLKSNRDRFVRIKQVLDAGMLSGKNISAAQENQILSFIEENINNFREVSLRSAVKIANLMEEFPQSWEDKAKVVLFRPR